MQCLFQSIDRIIKVAYLVFIITREELFGLFLVNRMFFNYRKNFPCTWFLILIELLCNNCLLSCLLMFPCESLFVLNAHLHPMTFTQPSNSPRFQTLLDVIKFISSFMVKYHKFDFLKLMTSENVSKPWL